MPRKPVEYGNNGHHIKSKNAVRTKSSPKSTSSVESLVPPPVTNSPCQEKIGKIIDQYLRDHPPETYKTLNNFEKMQMTYMINQEHIIVITINEIESFKNTGLDSIGFFIHDGSNTNKNIDDRYRLNINLSKICDKIGNNDTLDSIINGLNNRAINIAVTVVNQDNKEEISMRQYGLQWLTANRVLFTRHNFTNEMVERVHEKTMLLNRIDINPDDIVSKIALLQIDLKHNSTTTGNNKEDNINNLNLVKSLEIEDYKNEKQAKDDSSFVYDNTAKKQLESMAITHFDNNYKNNNYKPDGGMRRTTRRRVYFMSTKRRRRKNTRLRNAHTTTKKRRMARR